MKQPSFTLRIVSLSEKDHNNLKAMLDREDCIITTADALPILLAAKFTMPIYCYGKEAVEASKLLPKFKEFELDTDKSRGKA